MTASEKFEARLHELGLYNDWLEQGGLGRVGIQLVEEEKIIILVHESEDDNYTEFTYPPIWEMEGNEAFRRKALSEFMDSGDETFVRNLIRWYVKPSCKCPLFPVDVYFLWDDCYWFNFEDDAEEQEQEASNQTCDGNASWYLGDKAIEWCLYCDDEVELEHDLKVQRCPSCGHWIVPCSICPLENCSKPCPLEKMGMLLNGEVTETL